MIRKQISKSYKEIVSIPSNLKKNLPTSYDVIGDIAIIKLQEKLFNYKQKIGDSILNLNKHIKTVCCVKPVTGEFRTRDIEIIAGEQRTTTTHKEYGIEYNLDIDKTYFSPRLANERKRTANLVKDEEIVVDMFTGVGPFAIMIAKYAQPHIIYAIDKNKEAIKYAKQNIKKNKVLDKVEVIAADAQDIYKIIPKKADRIIMNLPFSAHLFFQYALHVAKDHCIIHYYDILEEQEFQTRVEFLNNIAKEYQMYLTGLNIRKIKTYAPREFYIGIDITARKIADVA